MASKYNYEQFLKPINSRMFSCNGCFAQLIPTDLAIDCADCGAVYCEKCVRNGTMDDHICEDDEFEFENEEELT